MNRGHSLPLPHTAEPPQAEPRKGVFRQAPPWLISSIVHGAAVLLLAIFAATAPKGADVEPSRNGGIVLVQRKSSEATYLSEGDDLAVSAGAAAAGRRPERIADPLPDAGELPLDFAGVLPARTELTGGVGEIGDVLPGAGDLPQGEGGKGTFGSSQTTTTVFGVQGRGSKFVYVFDRSGSMEGFGGRPLAAARRELIASLGDFDSIHQFQVIFYNERPKVFNPDPHREPRMMWGTDRDKRLAQDFVRGITADGGTQHMDALRMALALQPDVIFFLTDAEEPRLSDAELAQILRWNRGAASINAIEFGSTGEPAGDNFLKKLARQNGGTYKYQDVTRLPPP